MTQVIRYFAIDMRKGTVSQWRRFAFCLAAVFILAVLNQVYCCWFIAFGSDGGAAIKPLSFGESFVVLFSGMDFYYPGNGVPFSLPVEWMFVVLLALFLTLDYPLSDLEAVGANALVAGGSRSAWWVAKCLWVLAGVVAFCCSVFVAVALATLVMGGGFSLDIRADLLVALAFDTGGLTASSWDIVPFFVSVPLLLCALCLVQLLLSFIVRPLVGFGCMAALLFCSAYYANVLLPGEYLMAARSVVFLVDGYQIATGVLLAFLLGAWAMVSGLLLFRERDICRKD